MPYEYYESPSDAAPSSGSADVPTTWLDRVLGNDHVLLALIWIPIIASAGALLFFPLASAAVVVVCVAGWAVKIALSEFRELRRKGAGRIAAFADAFFTGLDMLFFPVVFCCFSAIGMSILFIWLIGMFNFGPIP